MTESSPPTGTDQLRAHIDATPGWSVALDETRARHVTSGAGSGHSTDRIVVARRA